MAGREVLLDAFTRIDDSLHRILPDLSEDELSREPHPSIGWLSWRVTRVADSNIARLWGREQLWIGDGWHARFNMPPEPADFGRAVSHNRAQVKAFHASSELLLAYQDASHAQVLAYLDQVTPEELDRELDERQYDPLPTVAVRLISVVENGMHNAGQMGYLKAIHKLGGWFPAEAPDRTLYR